MYIRSKTSFTIVETLISAIIFALVWLATINVILISKEMSSIAQHKVQAIYVAQRAIENLHRKTFSQVSSASSTVSIDTAGTPDTTTDDLMGTQTITVTSPSQYYKKAVVTVTWNEPFISDTRQMTERCGTLICNDAQAN